ncbi:MAG: hypothetical protein OJF51_003368 [Nitrospira sp.]|nr:MAG: hypothetical protein OJF51_003368 [Nitrospira sp.]
MHSPRSRLEALLEVYKTPPSGATSIRLPTDEPGGAPRVQFTENKGYRWYSQK